jgi:cytidylate kinase
VSIISSVRRAMVKQQQEMGKNKGIVMDGRDIGTVVFPYAELKIFMTANTQIRTERRLAELKTKGIVNMDFETVQKNLLERDHIDSTRLDSPLCKAEDAIVIDNSALTETQQLEIALHLAKDRIYKIMAEEGVDR